MSLRNEMISMTTQQDRIVDDLYTGFVNQMLARIKLQVGQASGRQPKIEDLAKYTLTLHRMYCIGAPPKGEDVVKTKVPTIKEIYDAALSIDKECKALTGVRQVTQIIYLHIGGIGFTEEQEKVAEEKYRAEHSHYLNSPVLSGRVKMLSELRQDERWVSLEKALRQAMSEEPELNKEIERAITTMVRNHRNHFLTVKKCQAT